MTKKDKDNVIGPEFPQPQKDRDRWLFIKGWYNFADVPDIYRISLAEFKLLAEYYHVPDGIEARRFRAHGSRWQAIEQLVRRGAIEYVDSSKKVVRCRKFAFELYEVAYWRRVNVWYSRGLELTRLKKAEYEAKKAEEEGKIIKKHATGKVPRMTAAARKQLYEQYAEARDRAKQDRLDS
jgi:hypothetical protein